MGQLANVERRRAAVPELCLSLMGGFKLSSRSATVATPEGSQRLLAYLAVAGRPVSRVSVWSALWPDVDDRAAGRRLRSALWRLGPFGRRAVTSTRVELTVADDVRVDVSEAEAIARRLVAGEASFREPDRAREIVELLSTDLLPAWYDDWAVAAAEAWRQLRMHALEVLAERLAAERRYGEAVTAAMTAVRAEPLRESAHAILVSIHLQEGNQAEALLAFRQYRDLLQAELGLEPTSRITALLQGVLPSPERARAVTPLA
jgi:DNA-binding SARP family transcriptional activator